MSAVENTHSGTNRVLDRLFAVIAIALVATSGGLLAELNRQAGIEARVAPFAQTPSAQSPSASG